MKKNWTMRAALLMVALTLITSCFVSGTYAKYVSAGSANDTARVAKWGVTVTGTGKAFGSAYVSATGKISGTYTAATDSVEALNGTDKLVAPGTGDDVAIITFDGQPEVDVHVTVEATVTLTNWLIDDDGNPATPDVEYCPLVFTIDGTNYSIDGTTITTVAELEAAVKAAIEAESADYEATTDLSAVSQPVLPVSWSWPFSTSAANDAKDTKLGNNAANNNAATVYIQIDSTVTQVD